jgi:hypothetical protein
MAPGTAFFILLALSTNFIVQVFHNLTTEQKYNELNHIVARISHK